MDALSDTAASCHINGIDALYGIRAALISHIVDDNVKRQGLYSPGSGIPVVSGSVLNQEDLCLILAWRHSSYIVPKLDKINTSWIIPLPNISKSTSL